MLTRSVLLCALIASMTPSLAASAAVGQGAPVSQRDELELRALGCGTVPGYLSELAPVLGQWYSALEAQRGIHFLTPLPVWDGSSVGPYLSALSPVLVSWKSQLEAWRGAMFLVAPPTYGGDAVAYVTALEPVLVQWRSALQSWQGLQFLSPVPAVDLDTEAPAITCPPDTMVTGTGPSGAAVAFTVSASDGCGAPAVVCVPSSGSTFPYGATSVVCTATDAAGNTASCSFTVTVTEAVPVRLSSWGVLKSLYRSEAGF